MKLEPGDYDYYLDIVRERIESRQNGVTWQRSFVSLHGRDMRPLTAVYAVHQQSGAPVHTWSP